MYDTVYPRNNEKPMTYMYHREVLVCNKTNPIFELYAFFRSFCIPYRLPLLSHDCQAHVRLIKQPPCSCTHDQELTHMIVSLIM